MDVYFLGLGTWWTDMTSFQRLFYYFAVPATLILILQTVLMLIGLEHGGADGSGDHEMGGHGMDSHDMTFHDMGAHEAGMAHGTGVFGPADAAHAQPESLTEAMDGGLRLFTLKGVVAFFALFGWTGALLSQTSIHWVFTLVISLLAGFAGMFLIALLFLGVSKLQSSGNISLRGAIGRIGTVYIPIPAEGKGHGKVNVMLQERLVELSAVTDGSEAIPFGTIVLVTGMNDVNTVVVKRKDKE